MTCSKVSITVDLRRETLRRKSLAKDIMRQMWKSLWRHQNISSLTKIRIYTARVLLYTWPLPATHAKEFRLPCPAPCSRYPLAEHITQRFGTVHYNHHSNVWCWRSAVYDSSAISCACRRTILYGSSTSSIPELGTGEDHANDQTRWKDVVMEDLCHTPPTRSRRWPKTEPTADTDAHCGLNALLTLDVDR